jgi:hypothetical protein
MFIHGEMMAYLSVFRMEFLGVYVVQVGDLFGLLLVGEGLEVVSVVLDHVLSGAVTGLMIVLLLSELILELLLVRADLLEGPGSNVLGDVLAILFAIKLDSFYETIMFFLCPSTSRLVLGRSLCLSSAVGLLLLCTEPHAGVCLMSGLSFDLGLG